MPVTFNSQTLFCLILKAVFLRRLQKSRPRSALGTPALLPARAQRGERGPSPARVWGGRAVSHLESDRCLKRVAATL